MLPSHIITSCVLANLDSAPQLKCRRTIPVGAAILTARAEHGEVGFTLDTFVVQPGDPTDSLLSWLDRQLTDPGATLAGYQLSAITTLLAQMPGASWSSALGNLAGRGGHEVVDLSASRMDGC